MKDLIKDIRESLELYANAKRVEFAKKSYPTQMHVIGVTVPDLRVVLKELRNQTKEFNTSQELDLIRHLIDEGVFELQQLAFEYLHSEKNLYKSLTQDFIEQIEKNLDNWLSVDYFGLFVVGIAWKNNLINTEKVKRYLDSEDFWARRIAGVATVALNQKARGGHGDVRRTLEICQLVVKDHQEMIVKSLSWALRELAKTDRESVIGFLDNNKERLHKKVLREVKNKLETGLKNTPVRQK